MRLLLSGGETGGHLYPALAVAEALAEVVPGSAVMYAGAAGRIDMAKAIGAECSTRALGMTAYDRSRPMANLALPFSLLRSMYQALRILHQYRPHAVMGLGAYPSVPVILAARMAGIPTLLFEPNAQPGMANSLLARVAQRICVSRTGMEAFFPRAKIVITGTPVRNRLVAEASDRQRAKALFGIEPTTPTVLITGGSTGSSAINDMILADLDLLAGTIGHLIWQTGEKDEQRVRMSLGKPPPTNCTLLPYIDRMGCAYGAADLVVSAAGATSLAELAMLGKPAMIIPDPNVTDNHQQNNARELHEKKACLLVDAEHGAHLAAAAIIALLNDHVRLERLKNNILRCARPEAARLVAAQLVELSGRGIRRAARDDQVA